MRRLAAVPVDKVRVPKDTLRQLDRDWAEAVGAMMAEEGQAQPIEVGAEGDGYVLVFGLHRLEGAKLAGLKTVDALIDEEGGDLAARRRRAIHENLGRRELSKLDRAVHIAELHTLMQAASPGRKRGGDRRSADFKGQKLPFGLREEIALRVGLSPRSVTVAIGIAHALSPSVRHRIVSSPGLAWIADSQTDLERLAIEPDQRQSRILDAIEAGKAGSVAEAIAFIDGEPAVSETERHRNLAASALARLTPRDRARLFDAYADELRAWAKKKGWV